MHDGPGGVPRTSGVVVESFVRSAWLSAASMHDQSQLASPMRYRRGVRVIVIALVAACGPGLKKDEPRIVARNALVEATQDPRGFERLLRSSVVNGGLWFDDPQCATQFQAPGEIDEVQLAAFGRCLAMLHLQPSHREDALGDVAVMQYGAGFEIEARVAQEHDGPRLSWIGYEARRDEADNAPTITHALLESLRTSGDRNGPLDPTVASTLELDPTPKSHAAYSWLKVCVDETGAVQAVHVHETTSVKASQAFAETARAWKFRAFTVQGQAIPVCAMVRMAYPADQAPPTERLPLPPAPTHTKKEPVVFVEGTKHSLLEGKRIAGPKQIWPDDATKTAIYKAHVSRVVGQLRVCIDETGHVESVLPMQSTGFADYDRRLIAGVRLWRYSPYQVDGAPVPVCTSVTFIYAQT